MPCRLSVAFIGLLAATPALAHADLVAHVHDGAGRVIPAGGGPLALLAVAAAAGLGWAGWRLAARSARR